MIKNKTKWKFILLWIAVVMAFPLSAKEVTKTEALRVADIFFNSNLSARSGRTLLKCIWDSNNLLPEARSASDAPTFYVFAAENGKGFVIVSGDDSTMPIFGYSFQDVFSTKRNLPPNLSEWFEAIHQTVSKARLNTRSVPSQVKREWSNPRAGYTEVLLETAKWNQDNPYNLQCPLDGAVRSVTGCVATASAIIMQYYQWPKAGKGNTEAYVTKTKRIEVKARNLEHPYDWNYMPLYDDFSKKYSNEEAEMVSTLMADIGSAFQVDYTARETGAVENVKVLYENFDYHSGMYHAFREFYSDEAWMKLLEGEIRKRRPVYYGGSGDEGGHAFVLDGVDSNGYFHINWGWGGYDNGYFLLDEIEYSSKQRAVINFVPNDGAEVENWIKVYSPGIVMEDKQVESSVPFLINELRFCNVAFEDFTGNVRLAHTDSDGYIKEWISEELLGGSKLESDYYMTRKNILCKITGKICTGDRIRLFYKSNRSNEWNLAIAYRNGYDCIWEIPIGGEKSIEEMTSISFDEEKCILTVRYTDGVKASVSLNGKSINSGIISQNDAIIVIDTQELSEGSYLLRLEKGEQVKEVTFTIKPL